LRAAVTRLDEICLTGFVVYGIDCDVSVGGALPNNEFPLPIRNTSSYLG